MALLLSLAQTARHGVPESALMVVSTIARNDVASPIPVLSPRSHQIHPIPTLAWTAVGRQPVNLYVRAPVGTNHHRAQAAGLLHLRDLHHSKNMEVMESPAPIPLSEPFLLSF